MAIFRKTKFCFKKMEFDTVKFYLYLKTEINLANFLS